MFLFFKLKSPLFPNKDFLGVPSFRTTSLTKSPNPSITLSILVAPYPHISAKLAAEFVVS